MGEFAFWFERIQSAFLPGVKGVRTICKIVLTPLLLHRDFDSFGNIVEEIHYDTDGVTPVTSSDGDYVDEEFGYTARYFDGACKSFCVSRHEGYELVSSGIRSS
jgi:hypothetical protein